MRWIFLASLFFFWAASVAGCAGSPEAGRQKTASTIGIEWVSVGGGSYQQGNPEPGEDMSDELPVRSVDVRDFDMLKTEVTVAQYRACAEAGACPEPDGRAGGESGRKDLPMAYVSWSDSVAFCGWIGGRLPTESEWEYAARNQGRDLYPWGIGDATCERAVMKNEAGPGCGTGGPMPVCSRPEGNTGLGHCDMIGNLWEWTLDWYHDSYAGAPADGSAWVDPRGETRTMRGGAFSYDAFWNRTTSRDSHGDPSFRVHTLGFRCVRGGAVEADYAAPAAQASGGGEYNSCGEQDCDFTCQSDPCPNPDGNTHDGCTCGADYCVPNESGVEFAGLEPLTCTTANCDPSNPDTCPDGTECKVIPSFVIRIYARKGIDMPQTMCGAP